MAEKFLDTRVQVVVRKSRGKKARQVRRRDEVRYGPYSPVEDDPRAKITTNVMFLDANSKWVDFGDANSQTTPGGPSLAAGVMSYLDRAPIDTYMPVLSDFYVDQLSGKYRQTVFNTQGVKLPPFSGTAYRQVEENLPIPFEVGGKFTGKPFFNSRGFDIKNGENWKKQSHTSQSTDEDHESSFPSGQSICAADVVPQLWFTHAEADQRALWRDHGVMRAKVPAGSYNLSMRGGVHFEPFDVTDTDNYKVVTRFNPSDSISTFDDSEEVVPEKIKIRPGAKLVKVWLVPQIWKFICTYTQCLEDVWTDQHIFNPNSTEVNVTWTRVVSDSGFMPAFCSPYPLGGWETPVSGISSLFANHPSALHASSSGCFDPDDLGDPSLLRLMMQLSFFQARAASVSPHSIPVTPGAGAPHTAQPPTETPGFPFYYIRDSGSGITRLLQQFMGTVVITQEGTPARALVGAFELSDDDQKRYFIYRKTPRVITPVTMYNGFYEDPGYNPYTNPNPSIVTCTKLVSQSSTQVFTGSYHTHPSSTPYPDSRFPWLSGGLCSTGQWPYLMRPRWSRIS